MNLDIKKLFWCLVCFFVVSVGLFLGVQQVKKLQSDANTNSFNVAASEPCTVQLYRIDYSDETWKKYDEVTLNQGEIIHKDKRPTSVYDNYTFTSIIRGNGIYYNYYQLYQLWMDDNVQIYSH